MRRIDGTVVRHTKQIPQAGDGLVPVDEACEQPSPRFEGIAGEDHVLRFGLLFQECIDTGECRLLITEAGIGFMFAPSHHPAWKNVGPTRVELATRTIFNLLGPLSNPAGVKRQMVGVFSRQWVLPLAQVLKNLGAESAWVAHGSDGLDEITLTGPTFVAALENGNIRTFDVTPEEAGLTRVGGDGLKGGDANANAVALQGVLDGKPSPYRDVALLNAAAALIVAGKAANLKEGVALGTKSLDSGAAAARLKQLIAVSNDRLI